MMYKTLHRKLNIGQHEPRQQIYIKGKYLFPFEKLMFRINAPLVREDDNIISANLVWDYCKYFNNFSKITELVILGLCINDQQINYQL
jgi:hypothetical protein